VQGFSSITDNNIFCFCLEQKLSYVRQSAELFGIKIRLLIIYSFSMLGDKEDFLKAGMDNYF